MYRTRLLPVLTLSAGLAMPALTVRADFADQLVAAVGAPKGGPADASPLGNLGAQAMNAAQTQPQPSAQPQQTVGAQNRVGAAAPRTATAPSVAPRR